jgi:adenylosuccinate lyase
MSKPDEEKTETPFIVDAQSRVRTTWSVIIAVVLASSALAGGWAILRADVNGLQKKTEQHDEQLGGIREILAEVRTDVKAIRREQDLKRE